MAELSYQNGLLFTRAYQMVRLRIYAILGEYSMTPSHWSILGASFNSKNGIKVTDISEAMGVTISMVTMLVNELSEQGFVKRLPHKTDGRAKLVVLTAKGKKFVNKLEVVINKEISKLLRGVSSNDIEAFESTLKMILFNAQA
jgi:DNA-binding MarR family transcriptional regulator